MNRFFLATSVLLLMSGAFHLARFLENEHYRQIFGRLDHIFIWIFFATVAYTVNNHYLKEHRRIFYNGILLALVCAGIWLKAFYYNETRGWVGFTIYILTFLGGVVSFFEISKEHGWKPLLLFFFAAFLIGTGGLIDRIGSPDIVPNYFEDHELFHIFVLGGMIAIGMTLRQIELSVMSKT